MPPPIMTMFFGCGFDIIDAEEVCQSLKLTGTETVCMVAKCVDWRAWMVE